MAFQVTSIYTPTFVITANRARRRRQHQVRRLLVSRPAHVCGLSNENPTEPFGIGGTIGTHLTILGAVGYLAWPLA
jgi:hypothetical protein